MRSGPLPRWLGVLLALLAVLAGCASDSEVASCDQEVVSTNADLSAVSDTENGFPVALNGLMAFEEPPTMWVFEGEGEAHARPRVWVWEHAGQFDDFPADFGADTERPIGDFLARSTSPHPLFNVIVFTEPTDPSATRTVTMMISVNVSAETAWELAPAAIELGGSAQSALGDLEFLRTGRTTEVTLNPVPPTKFTGTDHWYRLWQDCYLAGDGEIQAGDLAWAFQIFATATGPLTGQEFAIPLTVGGAEGALFVMEAGDDDVSYVAIASTTNHVVMIYNDTHVRQGDPPAVAAVAIQDNFAFG